MTTPDPTADDTLLADLRRALDAADPPPADLAAFGKAAFALRRIDDELAELVGDSLVAGATVRDAVATERLLAFAAGGVSIDVQISAAPDGSAELLGEIDPAPRGAVVSVQTVAEGIIAEVSLDSGGRFVVVVPGAAAVRLRVVRPGAPAVTTPWFVPGVG